MGSSWTRSFYERHQKISPLCYSYLGQTLQVMLYRRTLACLVLWVTTVLPSGAEETEFTPAALPPALPWSGPSEALIVDRDHPWITPAEEMGLEDSPDYPDTIAYLRRLCAASESLDLTEFGRTAEGRDLYVVIARTSVDGSDKPVVLAQAGIHSGEIDGKDAGLMLLRDIAFGGKEDLLRSVDFLLYLFSTRMVTSGVRGSIGPISGVRRSRGGGHRRRI